MFDCGFKSQYIGGQKEKFVRLDDLDSTLSMPANSGGMKRVGFNLDGLPFPGRRKKNASKSFRLGVQRGSNGLRTFGQSLRSGVTRAVFPEDLKVSEKKIFDPQDKSLLMWNKFFEVLCILSVSFDPLFFYLPVINHKSNCLGIDNNLAKAAVTLRTIFDTFYLIRIGFQFRTAYIAPSSRVFGRGELVIDPAQIAKRYLMRYFIVDFLSVLPIPQIVVWKYFNKVKKSGVLETKTELLRIVILQYLPRFARFIPLNSDVKKTAGVFSQNAVVGAIYYLVWFLLASHITGSAWYLLAVERNDACWQATCKATVKCDVDFLYCDNKRKQNYDNWRKISTVVLRNSCNVDDKNSKFNYGIYTQALSSGIVVSREVFSKFCYCLWWGLQNLSTLGSGLQTSTYPGEVLFSIVIAIAGLVLFALLIGNMQVKETAFFMVLTNWYSSKEIPETWLQSITVRLEEMRIKRRDSEQWMHHRLLPPELREKVRRYDQYKWLETRGVDEESLVRNLPKDLRRDIKRHLCLNLVRRVPLFANMDERLLDAICERLKPSLCTESTYLVREGDPVNEMLFIIRGRLESVTTDGGRSGFFNRGFLQEGDFCGEELLTWALDPKSGSNWPSSTRTVRAITEVEAFALEAEELKFVASQFRRLHSRQVQHTFRFYSQQWRTWASCFIQAAWRRYAKRKNAEKRRMEEIEEEELDYDDDARSLVMHNDGSSRLGATILASRFAANALRGHRLRSTSSVGLVKLQKPPEPDFASDDAD